VFIRSDVAREWILKAIPELRKNGPDGIGVVHILSRSGLLPKVHPKIRRYPSSKDHRRAGIMWGEYARGVPVEIVGRGKDDKPAVVVAANGGSIADGECPI